MPVIFVCDAKWDIVWIDSNFCTTIDCDRHPALRRSVFALLGVKDGDAFARQIRDGGVSSAALSYEILLHTPEGEHLPFRFSFEEIPHFEGVDDAAVIVVGVAATPITPSDQDARNRADREERDAFRQTYRYSNLRLEDGARLFSRLERLVDSEELYRDRLFSLDKAASRLETNALYISQITNFFSGTSFPNFLNHKRYADLAAILRADADVSLADAWRRAGFGSYSSLNRYLKTVKGTTPSKFLRTIRGADDG